MQTIRAALAGGVLAFLAACGGGGGGDADAPASAAPGTALVDAAGGTVTGADGASVVVPAGALKDRSTVTVAIAKSSAGAPVEPPGEGFLAVSNVFTITPHGHGFAQPVRVTLPFDASLVHDGDQLLILKAQPYGKWVAHSEVKRDGAMATLEVREFSTFMVVIRPALRITPAPSVPTPTPFSFTVAVSGTVPNLTITYTFSGTRPTCVEGDRLETVFMVEYDDSYHDPYLGLPQHSISRAELLAVTVPNFSPPAAPLAGNTLTHVVIQPPHAIGGDYPGDGSLNVSPYVKGRYTCTSERLANNDVAAPWTLESANWGQLPWNGSNVALLADIADVQTSVGAAVMSRARAQAPASGPLALQSKWEISRDNGATWALYKLGAERVTTDTSFYGEAAAQTAGLWALEGDLPAFAGTDSGALLRFSACTRIYPLNYAYPVLEPCVAGAPHLVSVAFLPAAPSFSVMPAPMAVVAGTGASFSVVAAGLPTPTLQWQRRLPNGAWEDIAGATAGTYNVATTTLGQDGTQFRVMATNASGNIASALATLNVVDQAAPPAISAVSGPLTVVRGGTAVFAATVKGTEPLSFQWRRNGADILGANTPILRLDGVADAQAGDYVLHVANPAGAVQTVAQTLTLADGTTVLPTAPAIVMQPVPVRVNAGNTATFAVGAGGSGPLAYQWRRDGVDIAGATGAFYSIAAAAQGDAATYSVVVGNGVGSATSAGAALTVDASAAPTAPVITAQPGAVVVAPGMSAVLAVAVKGSGPMSFQWWRDGVAVAGQTQAVYAIPAASSLDAGAYQVQISNTVGEVTSATVQVILLGAPAIVTAPGNRSVTEGATATFGVTASGNFVRYQWTRNQVAIAGATGASYTTPPLALADSGAVYAVIVYNGAGIAFSSGAVLTVAPAPVAKAWGTALQIEAENLGNAENVQVAVNASGQAVAVWQQSDGVSINIWAARYAPATGWAEPEAIDVDPETKQQPRVAIDAQGNAIVVWLRPEGGQNHLRARRYTPQVGWSNPTPIEDGLGEAGDPQIAMDGGGNAIVVFWQHQGGRTDIVAVRCTNSGQWGAPVTIENDSTGDASAPQIAMDAAGNATVVWAWALATGGPVFEFNVWANRYTPGSGWGSAGPIDAANATTANPAPQVALDGAGNAIAVWHRPDGSWDSIWSSRYVAGSGWGAPVRLETDNTNSARNAQVAFDASGNAIAVWIQSDGIRDNVLANRFTAGQGWGSAVPIETDNAGGALEVRLVIDGSGNATAVWSQRNVAGFTYNIWANRWTAATGWGSAGMIDNAPEPARLPQLGVDGLGNVVAVWSQSDGTRTNIWANAFR